MSERIILDPLKLGDEERRLKEFFDQRMTGQPRAIDRIVFSYGHYLASLERLKNAKLQKKRDKPIICALFLGPTGVGKTFVAELLAEYFFEDRTAFTNIIAENFLSDHELSSLLGTSAGYIGYDHPGDPKYSNPPILDQRSIDRFAIEFFEKSVLDKDDNVLRMKSELKSLKKEGNEALLRGDEPTFQKGVESFLILQERLENYIDYRRRDKKFLSIILVDEIEKGPLALAHHVLLQPSDKGVTFLKNGRMTDFTNSFIIGTSNLGSKAIAHKIRGVATIGFTSPAHIEQSIFDVCMEEVERFFSPEFIARIEDNIVAFKPLNTHQLHAVFDMRIKEFYTDLAIMFPIECIIHDDVKKFIFDKAFKHPEYGARPLASKLKKYLEEPLSRLTMSGQVSVGDRVYVDTIIEYGEVKIIFTKDSVPSRVLVKVSYDNNDDVLDDNGNQQDSDSENLSESTNK